jgi:hypothetical protein
MKQRFYLDTAIWRDYFEDRKDNLQPLGEFAFQFLKNCEKQGCEILYSQLVVQELNKRFSAEQVERGFESYKQILREVYLSPQQLAEARKLNIQLKDTHTSDITHAILARDNGAIMITRDRHFEALEKIVENLKPEEVTFD